jgi:hypothetical protein
MTAFDAPCRSGSPPRRYRLGSPYQSLLCRFMRQHKPFFRLRAPDSDRSHSRSPKFALQIARMSRHWRLATRYVAKPSFRHVFATLGLGTRLLALPLPRVSSFRRAGLTQRLQPHAACRFHAVVKPTSTPPNHPNPLTRCDSCLPRQAVTATVTSDLQLSVVRLGDQTPTSKQRLVDPHLPDRSGTWIYPNLSAL